MPLLDTILANTVLKKAVIAHKAPLSVNTFHIRIHGESLKDVDYIPGHFLRVYCGMNRDVAFKDKIRSYSVWNYDRQTQSIDIAACTHSNGPGTQWVKDCKAGDAFYFRWHTGRFIIDNTGDYYVFIGDLSALAHLYEINRHLSQGKEIYSFIYSEKESDFYADINGTKPFNLYPVSVDPAGAIIKKLAPALTGNKGKGIAYIGGDSRVCLTLNAYFRRELKWPASQIKTKPFWNPLKAGLE